MIVAVLWAIRDLSRDEQRQVDAMDRLLELCHGDEDQVFRLIDAEKKKNPEMSNKQAARRALRSLEYDRKR